VYQTAGAGMRLQKFEERTSTTLVSIQALRALAAFMVLALHVSLAVAKLTPATILTPGAAGVDLFFVISGFVMLYSS
jgi:exopolysaccharide production protein ExoZ